VGGLSVLVDWSDASVSALPLVRGGETAAQRLVVELSMKIYGELSVRRGLDYSTD
jgi:hypothetical protein